jgi:hypothetical protein
MCDSSSVGGEMYAKKTLAMVVDGPATISTYTLSEISAAPPIEAVLLAHASPPFGAEGKKYSYKYLPFDAPLVAYVLPRSAAICIRHMLIRTIPPVPL